MRLITKYLVKITIKMLIMKYHKIKLDPYAENIPLHEYFPKIKNPKVIDHLTDFVQIATKNHGQMLSTLQE